MTETTRSIDPHHTDPGHTNPGDTNPGDTDPGDTDPDCIFCRIVAGEIPSRQVHTDDQAVAFLDLAPFQRGHTLVIPRRHVVNVLDADGALAAIAPAVEQVARTLTARLGADGVNVFSSAGAVAGQEVFHLHVHVVPRYADHPGLRALFGNKHEASADELDEVWQTLTGESA